MSPDMIDAMMAAGLTREQMAALIKLELEKEQAKKEARRAGNAERQRRFKERKSNALPALADVTEALPSVTASREIENAPTHAEPEPNKTTYPTTSEANASSVEPRPADLPLTGELLPPIAKPKPPPNAARGCRLPPGFPGDDEREWTRINLRFTDDDFERCRDEFRDYWSGVPGQRGVKCDWPATFRNAARKYRPSGGSRQAYAAGNQRSDGSLLGAYQRAASRVRASNDVSRQRAGVFDNRDGELGMHYGIPAE